MCAYTGRVAEIRLETGGQRGAWIECPAKAIPEAGRYLVSADSQAILGTPIFAGMATEDGFFAVPPIPPDWEPGATVELHGPFGRGFHLPARVEHLALATLNDSVDRLLPLAAQAIHRNAAVAVFGDVPLPPLPSAVEANPINALPGALTWADFLALEVPIERVPELRTHLGLRERSALPCAGQALVLAAMPCAGLADCGVCAVLARRRWKLACRHGPVFDLATLLA